MQPVPAFRIVGDDFIDYGEWQGRTPDEAIDGLLFSLGFNDRASYHARYGQSAPGMVATPIDPRALRHERAHMRARMADDQRPFASDQIGPIVRDSYIAASRWLSGGPIYVEAMAIGPQDDDEPLDGPLPAAHRSTILAAHASADDIIDTALCLIDGAADAAAAGLK